MGNIRILTYVFCRPEIWQRYLASIFPLLLVSLCRVVTVMTPPSPLPHTMGDTGTLLCMEEEVTWWMGYSLLPLRIGRTILNHECGFVQCTEIISYNIIKRNFLSRPRSSSSAAVGGRFSMFHSSSSSSSHHHQHHQPHHHQPHQHQRHQHHSGDKDAVFKTPPDVSKMPR